MNLLEEIRTTETPGKRGGEFLYAQAVYSCFSDIEILKAEGFTLATICKYLEKREILPKNSDPHSFCRAFRREIKRRQRAELKEVNTDDTTKRNINTEENFQKRDVSKISEQKKPEIPFIPARAKNGKAGLHVNPDNTFKMPPKDLDDMPDII